MEVEDGGRMKWSRKRKKGGWATGEAEIVWGLGRKFSSLKA